MYFKWYIYLLTLVAIVQLTAVVPLLMMNVILSGVPVIALQTTEVCTPSLNVDDEFCVMVSSGRSAVKSHAHLTVI